MKVGHPWDLGSPDAHPGACLSGFASPHKIPHSQVGLPLGEEKLKSEPKGTPYPPGSEHRILGPASLRPIGGYRMRLAAVGKSKASLPRVVSDSGPRSGF